MLCPVRDRLLLCPPTDKLLLCPPTGKLLLCPPTVTKKNKYYAIKKFTNNVDLTSKIYKEWQ